MSNATLKRHKDALARLLAAENIRVTHRKQSTAHFELKSRTLVLPLWENISPALYDLLVGHEVGHALFTPEEGWHTALHPRGAVYKGYLNVIEDARIERLIKEKFPGMVVRFEEGYTDLLKRGFFGVRNAKDAAKLCLIDRINLFFKVGTRAKVPFSSEEMVFVKRIQKAETWDDVEEVTNAVFKYVGVQTKVVKQSDLNEKAKELEELRKKMREIADEMSDEQNEYDEDEVADTKDLGEYIADIEREEEESARKKWEDKETEFEDDGETLADGDESFIPDQEETLEEFVLDKDEEEYVPDDARDLPDDGTPATPIVDKSDDEQQEQGNGEGVSAEDVPAPETDDYLRDQLEDLADTSSYRSEPEELKFGRYNAHRYVVPFKKVMRIGHTVYDYDWQNETTEVVTHPDPQTQKEIDNLKKFAPQIGKAYFNHVKRSVDHMVREFEMRKSARTQARVSMKKTGILDPVRMNRYKFDDDVFKKMSVVPQGKNHGFVMYLDWSGSMSSCILDTVLQIALLAFFCKKINVPFRAYAFSNLGTLAKLNPVPDQQHEDLTLVPDERLRLLELFSEGMSTKQLLQMTGMLALQVGGTRQVAYKPWFPKGLYEVWGTDVYKSNPLELSSTPLDSTLLLATELHDQFKATNNLDIVNTIVATDGASDSLNVMRDGKPSYNGGYSSLIPNPRGGWKTVKGGWTNTLLERYRTITGSNTIGYYITDNSQWNKAPHWVTALHKKGWVSRDNTEGYDTYICIHPKIFGEETTMEDSLKKCDERGTKIGKHQLAAAMRNAAKSKKQHRSMLTRISQRVA